MKYTFIFLLTFLSISCFGQLDISNFIEGTWKIDGRESYERWDKLNHSSYKGFSYDLVEGKMEISEYLNIENQGKEIVYTASVLKQNSGKGVDFKLTSNDSAFTFENQKHDFPKKIIYKKIDNYTYQVQVSDGKKKGFSYKITKQDIHNSEKDSSVSNPNYDADLAKRVGADDYGMKSYIFVILKSGTNKSTDKKFINESFRGHLENINSLVEEGKLIVAGPFGENDADFRGLFILQDIATISEAELLLQSDPAIKANLLSMELYTWYGSAALAEYLLFSDKIWKIKP